MSKFPEEVIPSHKQYVTLHNSKRQQPAGARAHKESRPDEIIRVTVVVRAVSSPEDRQKAIQDLALQIPSRRRHLNRQEFTRLHGARSEDLLLVKKFAEDFGLHVIQTSKERRCVVLSGTVTALSRAFQVENKTYTHGGHVYRSYPDAIQIPSHLNGIVEAVLGLENRPLMTHHTFVPGHRAIRHVEAREVAEAYKFPTRANGKGQCIAIIELGGGFYHADIKNYFRIHRLHQPKISVVEIDGHRNNPAAPCFIEKVLNFMGVDPNQKALTTDRPEKLDIAEMEHAMWTIETTLDIQLAGSFANDAHIVVYFAPNNAQGKYQALTTALTNKKYQPTLITCSWGAVEDDLPLDVIHTLDHVFQDAALRGVTVCFSSGDRGEDPAQNGQPRVHFPASSPHVLSCGGSHWVKKRRYINEIVWSESLPKFLVQSGGGVSKIFDQPDWQTTAGINLQLARSGRGVPDVAGKADIATGYCMLVGGCNVTMGGTSAAAPMWAGLIARLNQELGYRIGFLTPFLYQELCRPAFNDITKGNNGKHFKAGPGWDPCTGWGTPNGQKLLAKLRGK